jgi:CRP-like cAMP-binding protein
VYKQGQVADQIYVVKQGEIELSRITYSEPAKLIDPQVKSLMVSNRFRKSKRTKVALISAKQIFGQEEVFKECRRGTTATCISENASLLILGKDVPFRHNQIAIL